MNAGYKSGVFAIDAGGLRKRYREIFSDKLIFIRELLQNALQAVRSCNDDPASHRIEVRLLRSQECIDVLDDGAGMPLNAARLAVARFFRSAWTESNKEEEDSCDRADLLPTGESGWTREVDTATIGRFGVGMTTCLMVADAYEFITRPSRSGQPSAHRVEVDALAQSPIVNVYHADIGAELEDGWSTRVRVHLGITNRDATRVIDRACLDEDTIRRQILRYMSLVEVPILLNGSPVVGIGPDRSDIPEIFHTAVEPREGEALAVLKITERDEDAYVRALLTVSDRNLSSGRIRVYGRGVYVGELPATEVLGERLSMFGGSVDSNRYNLQFDRNRLQTDRDLEAFQEAMQITVLEALARWSRDNWCDFVKIVATHRTHFLHFMYQSSEATLTLGARIPFSNALDPERPQPLEWFVKHATKLPNGTRVLPFVSPHCRNHPAISVWSSRGVPVIDFGHFAPTEHGKANLDFVFVKDHLNEADIAVAPVRVDVLLRDISEAPDNFCGQRPDSLMNDLRRRYASFCDIQWTELDAGAVPALLATAYPQMLSEELPGFEQHAEAHPLLKILRDLADDEDLNDIIESVRAARDESKRPLVLINVNHVLVQQTVRGRFAGLQKSSRARAIESLDVLVATTLLSSGRVSADQLRERIASSLTRLQ